MLFRAKSNRPLTSVLSNYDSKHQFQVNIARIKRVANENVLGCSWIVVYKATTLVNFCENSIFCMQSNVLSFRFLTFLARWFTETNGSVRYVIRFPNTFESQYVI